MNSYKDSAAASLQDAKHSVENGAHDAKAYAEKKGEEAKSTWWSWFSWGSNKSEEAKEVAAQKAAQGAANVKEKAADAEKSAQRRA